jgi:hypothetical protein
LLAAVAADPRLERAAGAGARSVDELAGGVMGVGLADAMVLDAVLPQAANATAEPSASTTVGTAMVRDTRFLLCPGIYRYDLFTAVDGATWSRP